MDQVFDELFEEPHHKDDRPVDEGLEKDGLDQGAMSKRRKNGIVRATSTAFSTTSAVVVATMKLPKVAR